ncbi:ATP-dependent DNA helicase RecG [Aestuariivirga sp.]|uniref:ATP-dependent DNA helicase RecG n=1 Tax=Aestuariivirga sp. TaxID=2650926 RepID=UPI0025BEA65F|nr:ATP-dependent DNA helicase RecG [Aestuariivirga sp.]MCA3554512.1 ATP-dependent DNA helicase RecG [Aestuariivirga sp.]
MRPPLLNPLFAGAAGLKGIGARLDKLLTSFLRPAHGTPGDTTRIVDLLFHLPSGIVDRRFRPKINALPRDGVVTVEATVMRHRPPPPGNKRAPYRVDVSDGTGPLTLVFFHAFADSIRRALPEGETRFISGKIDWFNDEPQIAHPDHIVAADEFGRMPLIEPVYPLTEGLSPKVLAKAIAQALEKLPGLPEWQDLPFLQRHGWPDFAAALRTLHHPVAPAAVGQESPARRRLAYDELLANQLALTLVRANMKRARGRKLPGTGDLRAKLIKALPYSLTAAQSEAVKDILRDMASGDRMLRLLQGDVGSGKTVVALLALATAIESGAQGALMAPTEILARQHHATLSKLGAAAGISVSLLTGREKGKTREDILALIAAGETSLVVGTHALFQEHVAFRDLGLVVIDEQHRFGVHQRLALQAKGGGATDLLVMTATPIPRTLALTVYGDMDVSKLTEKPAGRLPIDTRVIPMARMDDVIEGLARSMALGNRAYWVCPLVEESEQVDLAAAEERFLQLASRFKGQAGLIHGRMKGPDKDRVMQEFKDGTLQLLVSTTVIEVGVDVPEATAIVIENAERFGLAQLHQLRGRVGRGSGKSSCLLLYQEPLGETARARLSIMRGTEDGFRIAEEDLRLRGAGEMLGTRQSGLPLFRMADLSTDGDLLQAARDDAQLALNKNPELTGPRGEALRLLLYLFERDEAIRLLSAG